MSKEPESFVSFFKLLMPGSQFSVSFLPGKTSLNLVAFLVNIFDLVKPFELVMQNFFFLAVSGIRLNDRNQLVHLNLFFSTDRIKPWI